MKSKKITLTCSLLLIALAAFCNPDLQEIRRKVTKTFQVGSNAELKVENKYGHINIIEWNKNEISFDIEIIGKASDNEDAKLMADRIDINFNQTGNIVSAETIFKEVKVRSNNRGTEIHYTINVPSSVMMSLINKYGNIKLEKTAQPFKCELKYGNLIAGQLTGKSNDIQCKYGNLTISEISSATITLGYGKIDVDKAGELSLTSAYSKIKMEQVSTFNASSRYDQYDLGIVKDFKLSEGSYGDFSIMRLDNLLDAPSIRYGKIRIFGIASGFETININSTYTNIKLQVSPKLCFQTKLTTRYGDIDISKQLDTSKLNWKKEEGERFVQSASGIIGSQSNPKARITINTTYDSIFLEE